ncbi:MAG: tetratricopeptide repeat protein [Candidatus Eisenbacteria bacterium]
MFTDPALRPVAGRFVWLALDGEKAKNAAVSQRLRIPGYPTFYILDPVTERIALRWVGSMTVDQMQRILASGETAVRGGGTPLDAAMVRADSLYAVAADSAATTAYLDLLARVPPDWPNRQRVLESALFAAARAGRNAEGAALAETEMRGRPHGAPLGNVASAGLECALALPETDPKRAGYVVAFEPVVRAVASDTTLVIAGDDRSGLWITLLDTRQDARDSLGAHQVAEAWAGSLERDARRATTPAQRCVYDAHRLSAYIELGEPERAVPMLEQTARDFPDDYNPHARLAIAYNAMKRYPEALAESDRALAMSYGPRKIGFYRTRVDIYVGLKDWEGARKTCETAIAYIRALPAPQRSESSIAGFEKRLQTLP